MIRLRIKAGRPALILRLLFVMEFQIEFDVFCLIHEVTSSHYPHQNPKLSLAQPDVKVRW